MATRRSRSATPASAFRPQPYPISSTVFIASMKRARARTGERVWVFRSFDRSAARTALRSKWTARSGAAVAFDSSSALLRQVQVRERAIEGLRRQPHGLRQGRVWMHGQCDVSAVGAGLDRERDLGNQLTGVGPDDAAAEHAVCLRIKQQLGEAFIAANRERAAARC